VATGLPSQTQVIELLDAEFTRAGYEIDDVVIDARARPPRITVIADGDSALDLDTAAALSRSASALLDEVTTAAGAYRLEVSSPGVDRPLTVAKHFRRARGRKVEVTLTDRTVLTGRVGASRADGFDLVVKAGQAGWSVRQIPLAQVAQAIVQIEFAAPTRRELELAGVSGPAGNVDTEEAGA